MSSEALPIDVEQLREKLERGDKIVVLDVRPTSERAEWRIPGSLHHDAYEALRAQDPQALADVVLDRRIPVVVVCGAGRNSALAASLLRERGYDAFTLTGGMKAWSLAWNRAELDSPTATLVQVRRTGKGCLSYVVASGSEAAVVDPSLDPAVYLGLAAARGWTIRHVLDTHIHADHLSRARALADSARATLWLPAQDRARFAHRALRDGDVLEVGRTSLRALHTPGHTLESASYLADERWLLTGDTLFPAAVGRPDLEASASEARMRAIALHGSLRRLLALDPQLLVLAAHADAPVPFDEIVVGSRLGVVREAIRLPEDASAFADAVLQRIPQNPPNHHTIVAHNEAGELPEGDAADLEAGANRCAIPARPS